MSDRFFLFAYDTYYPGGGLSDYVGSYAAVEEARDAYAERSNDYGEIVQVVDGNLVEVESLAKYVATTAR